MASLEDALARLSISSSVEEAKGAECNQHQQRRGAGRVYTRKSKRKGGRKEEFSASLAQPTPAAAARAHRYQFSAEDERKLADAFAYKGSAANDQVLTTNYNIQIHRYPSFNFFNFNFNFLNHLILI
jgi:hypothetical protein